MLSRIFLATLAVFAAVDSLHSLPRPGDFRSRITVYYTRNSSGTMEASLKGKIIEFSIRQDSQKNELMKIAQGKTQATVRLYDRDGVRIGSTLYAVDSKNLIIAKLTVQSIFKSVSFGYLAICVGNLRLASRGDRIVLKASDESAKFAYRYKTEADYYRRLGDRGKAISLYKQAIGLDRGYPEAHLALGSLYLDMGMLGFAIQEYDEAYREIERLYDRQDRYNLLKGMVDVRNRAIDRDMAIPNNMKKRYKEEAIKYSQQALRLHPDSKEVNFYLGMIYFKGPDPSDVKAKKQFLKVIELDPGNAEAYTNLAVLYQKHRNKRKAKLFADKALEIDSSMERARDVLKAIE